MSRFLAFAYVAIHCTQALAYSGKPLLLTSGFPAANTYYIAYYDFLSLTAGVAVPANSFLQFDEFIPADSAVQSGSLDFVFSGGSNTNLRDYQTPSGQYIRDQNYLRAHPFSDLSAYAKGQWYTRKFDMGAVAGKTFYEVCLATDTGNLTNGAPANLAGSFNGYIDNVHFTNAYGVVLKDLYSSGGHLSLPGSPTQSSTVFSNANSPTAVSNVVASVGSLALAAAPAIATVGQAITLTGTFDDAASAGIPYANLELTANRAQDQMSATKGQTNASGNLTVTVKSTVVGASGALVTAGPFSGSVSYSFVAAAALSWSVGTSGQTLVIGPGSTALSVEAVDAYGNLTSSARIVKVTIADAGLQLSLDNSTWVAAATGVTLSPGAGVGTVYARISSGAYRTGTLQAADAGGTGPALSAGSGAVVVNPAAAASVSLGLAATGSAGASLALSATALDAGSNPANSNATLSFSATNASALFSTDSGNTWNSSASVA
ncbi:MAG TPA: hypothetical protein VNZ67_13650, partial [bacterium]|nr:hypothetical protein [bacterium]